jgi:hypothetical protein
MSSKRQKEGEENNKMNSMRKGKMNNKRQTLEEE